MVSRSGVGDPVAACALIGNAKGEVFVCDPVFRGGRCLEIILAIADPQTTVRVLASARHLKADHGAVGEALDAALVEAVAAPPVSPIEIRVMPGKQAPIYDRFLALGDAMWMLGASLNHFGDRGTLMVRVPDPEPVRADLEEIWNASPGLAAWLAPRRSAPRWNPRFVDRVTWDARGEKGEARSRASSDLDALTRERAVAVAAAAALLPG